MNKRERTKMLNHLLDVSESVVYLQERVRLAKGIDLEILRKNLHYALAKEEELCKKLTEHTSLTRLTNTVLNTTCQEEMI